MTTVLSDDDCVIMRLSHNDPLPTYLPQFAPQYILHRATIVGQIKPLELLQLT